MKNFVNFTLIAAFCLTVLPNISFARMRDNDSICDKTLSGNLKTSEVQAVIDTLKDRNRDRQLTLCLAPKSLVLLEKPAGNFLPASIIINKKINIMGTSPIGRSIIGNNDAQNGTLINITEGGELNLQNIDLISRAMWSRGISIRGKGRVSLINNCRFYQYGGDSIGIELWGAVNQVPMVNTISNSLFHLDATSENPQFGTRATGVMLYNGNINNISQTKIITTGPDDIFLSVFKDSKVGSITKIDLKSSDKYDRPYGGNYRFISADMNSEIGTILGVKGKVSFDAYYFFLALDSKIGNISNIELELSGKADSIYLLGLYNNSLAQNAIEGGHLKTLNNVKITSIPREENYKALIEIGANSSLGKMTDATINGEPLVVKNQLP